MTKKVMFAMIGGVFLFLSLFVAEKAAAQTQEGATKTTFKIFTGVGHETISHDYTYESGAVNNAGRKYGFLATNYGLEIDRPSSRTTIQFSRLGKPGLSDDWAIVDGRRERNMFLSSNTKSETTSRGYTLDVMHSVKVKGKPGLSLEFGASHLSTGVFDSTTENSNLWRGQGAIDETFTGGTMGVAYVRTLPWKAINVSGNVGVGPAFQTGRYTWHYRNIDYWTDFMDENGQMSVEFIPAMENEYKHFAMTAAILFNWSARAEIPVAKRLAVNLGYYSRDVYTENGAYLQGDGFKQNPSNSLHSGAVRVGITVR